MIVKFYGDLYMAQECTRQDYILQVIPKLVNQEVNEALTCCCNEEEIKKAVLKMGGDKASSLDRFLGYFFSNFIGS